MSFLPSEFAVPAVVETERFRLRSITIHDAFKDYDAVMSSRDHLWSRFRAIWGWPAEGFSIEQNIIDLAWHQKEFQLRSSFDYAVMSLDESRLLSCVYIDPPHESGTGADVRFWARHSELSGGLEDHLGQFVGSWLASHMALQNGHVEWAASASQNKRRGLTLRPAQTLGRKNGVNAATGGVILMKVHRLDHIHVYSGGPREQRSVLQDLLRRRSDRGNAD